MRPVNRYPVKNFTGLVCSGLAAGHAEVPAGPVGLVDVAVGVFVVGDAHVGGVVLDERMDLERPDREDRTKRYSVRAWVLPSK